MLLRYGVSALLLCVTMEVSLHASGRGYRVGSHTTRRMVDPRPAHPPPSLNILSRESIRESHVSHYEPLIQSSGEVREISRTSRDRRSTSDRQNSNDIVAVVGQMLVQTQQQAIETQRTVNNVQEGINNFQAAVNIQNEDMTTRMNHVEGQVQEVSKGINEAAQEFREANRFIVQESNAQINILSQKVDTLAVEFMADTRESNHVHHEDMLNQQRKIEDLQAVSAKLEGELAYNLQNSDSSILPISKKDFDKIKRIFIWDTRWSYSHLLYCTLMACVLPNFCLFLSKNGMFLPERIIKHVLFVGPAIKAAAWITLGNLANRAFHDGWASIEHLTSLIEGPEIASKELNEEVISPYSYRLGRGVLLIIALGMALGTIGALSSDTFTMSGIGAKMMNLLIHMGLKRSTNLA